MQTSYKIILGAIGTGQQPVGNRVMAQVLADHGVNVINLGTRTNPLEFVRAAAETGADGILVACTSSLSDCQCQTLRGACQANGIGDILLYLGGRILRDHRNWDETADLFLGLGFDRVFPPRANVTRIADLLKSDIDMRRPGAFIYGVESFGVALAVARFD